MFLPLGLVRNINVIYFFYTGRFLLFGSRDLVSFILMYMCLLTHSELLLGSDPPNFEARNPENLF